MADAINYGAGSNWLGPTSTAPGNRPVLINEPTTVIDTPALAVLSLDIGAIVLVAFLAIIFMRQYAKG